MTKADSPPKPPTKLQTITLKVSIHCEGCRRKVRRIIRVVDGVEDVTVDSATGKVTITGSADVKTILQRLQKYGKQAEVWPTSNPAPAPANKAGGNQPKANSNNASEGNSKKKGNSGTEGGGKPTATAGENGNKKGDSGKEATTAAKGDQEGKVDGSKPEKSKEAKPKEAEDGKAPAQNGGGGGGGGKKGGKKGGNGSNTNNNDNNSSNSGGATGGDAAEVLSLGPPAQDTPILHAPNSSVVVSASKSLAPYDSIQTGYAYQSADYATHMFSDENANNCSIM